MKRIFSILLTVSILLTMATSVAAEGTGVDLSATISSSGENTVLSVSEGIASGKPEAEIACTLSDPIVKYNGKRINSSFENGVVKFLVDKAGDYIIMENDGSQIVEDTKPEEPSKGPDNSISETTEVKNAVAGDGSNVTAIIKNVSVDGWTYGLTGEALSASRTVLLSTVNGSKKVEEMPDEAKRVIEEAAGKLSSSYVTSFIDLSLIDSNSNKVEKRATFTLTLSKDVAKGLKSVYILHMKNDGSFECVPATLSGNNITFTLNSQSPIAYVLNYGYAKPVVNTSADIDSSNIGGYVLGAASLVMVLLLSKKYVNI